MSKSFAALLAQRFAPLEFSSVPCLPHIAPDMFECGDFLPVFKEEEQDNPVEHLLKFHECMDLLDQWHEDVRMNMFMYHYMVMHVSGIFLYLLPAFHH